MSRIKVLLISSSVIFVVCVLLAFFSGSSIFLSLFKALVSSVLVVVFLLVANFFLAKYVPDIFEGGANADEPESAVVGANLDIKIGGGSFPEENAQEMAKPNYSPSASTSFEASKTAESVSEDIDEGELSTPSVAFTPLNFSKEDNHLDTEAKNVPVDNMQKSPSEVESQVNVDDAEISQKELSKTIDNDVDRLEELPDLQEFVDSSNLNIEQTKGDELMSVGTQSFFATDLSEDVTDTNLMAKAVRTVLKREI